MFIFAENRVALPLSTIRANSTMVTPRVDPRPSPEANSKTSSQRTLAVTDVVKHFGPVKANDGVTCEFRTGEIHALLGENGAGKSTLIKILAGVYMPDEGSIKVDGRIVGIRNPDDSRKMGIAVVHQQSALVPRLTVLENVVLQLGGLGPIDRQLGARMAEMSAALGFAFDIRTRVEDLTVGERQRAEIARALMAGASFVVLDEPTSVLAPSERSELFRLLQQLALRGAAVIIVTHRLEEALIHSGRITVMRQGRVVTADRPPRGLSEEDLVRMMVGEISTEARIRQRERAAGGTVVIRVAGVSGSPSGGKPLNDVELHAEKGEVLGIAGIEGNGQRELSALLTGAWKPLQGDVELNGVPMHQYSHAERSRLIADVPDDETLALSYEFSVWENLGITALAWWHRPTPAFKRQIRTAANDLVQQFDVRTPSVDTQAGRLSGGNRRRLTLARELSKTPELLVATYPTKGLDVKSVEQVKRWLVQLTERGTAVVYIASDLDEILAVSDRIAVLTSGRIVGVVTSSEATAEHLGKLMLLEGQVQDADSAQA